LHDLVSYNHKHNQANGEDNRDGTDDNRSWNCGVEGGTTEPGIISLRERQQRNFLATLFLSQGVPMLLHGDELGRTQGGNNNAYCQDNETSWVDWERARDFEWLTEFTARLIRLRRDHPVFRRRRFFQGRPVRGTNLEDIAWLTPAGLPMTDEQWTTGQARALGIFLNGDGLPDPDRRGRRPRDRSFLLLVNPTANAVTFVVPDERYGSSWTVVLDTATSEAEAESIHLTTQPEVRAHSRLDLYPNSLRLLMRH
jgi:isoamylase